MQIYYSKIFFKKYKNLPKYIQSKFKKQESVFRKNPFDPSLKTHPLTERLKGFYSFSINYHYRVIFNFESEDEIWFHSIGTHSIYK